MPLRRASSLYGWLSSIKFGLLVDIRGTGFRQLPQLAMSACLIKTQLLQCVVAREVWHICREQLEFNIEELRSFDTIEELWINECRCLRRTERKGFDIVVCLICYTLWKNRNAWVFENVAKQHSPIFFLTGTG
jgi:hypothetical protein